MQRKRTRTRGAHPGATPHKRHGKVVGYRAQVIDPLTGKKVSANKILRVPGKVYPLNKAGLKEASEACWQAEALLTDRRDGAVTVSVLRERWLARTHHRGRPIKESSHSSNDERTLPLLRFFSDDPAIGLITEDQAREFGRKVSSSHREATKALFNFAVDEGLLPSSPFRQVRTEKGAGRGEVTPPTERQADKLSQTAWQMLPSWGAWLDFGMWVGTRPGETDGIRVGDFNEDFTLVRILRQWNQRVGKITSPKHVHTHWIAVPPRAQAAVKAMLPELRRRHGDDLPDAYVFSNTRGNHWTPSSRAYYWKATKTGAGVTHNEVGEKVDCYLATRHFCGWYLVNVKGHSSEDVAYQLRHDDGGQLVRTRYGHRDRALATRGILASFDVAHNPAHDATRKAA